MTYSQTDRQRDRQIERQKDKDRKKYIQGCNKTKLKRKKTFRQQ